MRTLAAPPRPASPEPPPAAPDQHDEPGERDGTGPEAGLDAYIARLVDQAPPLSSEQRDTLALILRRPCRTPGQPPRAATPDPVPQRVDPFHG
jgi:hypothetical protein